MLLDSPLRDDELLARIEAVGYGATAISQSLLERLLQALPNAGFRQFYGQTETGASVAVLRPDYHVLSGPSSGHLTSCRSEEHTSELQSLMRISYAVFCLKKKKNKERITTEHRQTQHE